VVAPSDADAMAEALTRLHASETLRLALGAQALRDVEDYAWERVADRRRRALSDFAAEP